jgi:hypothetical protein
LQSENCDLSHVYLTSYAKGFSILSEYSSIDNGDGSIVHISIGNGDSSTVCSSIVNGDSSIVHSSIGNGDGSTVTQYEFIFFHCGKISVERFNLFRFGSIERLPFLQTNNSHANEGYYCSDVLSPGNFL